MGNPEMGGSRPDDEQNEPFDLSPELLSTYPEMQGISGLPKQETPHETLEVSQVFTNGNTIDIYIEYVKAGNTTGSIEYLLQMVENGLRKLSELNKPEYQKFIQEESRKLEERKAKATQAIGDKKRGPDGIYR
jgi:hypothetical protein